MKRSGSSVGAGSEFLLAGRRLTVADIIMRFAVGMVFRLEWSEEDV